MYLIFLLGTTGTTRMQTTPGVASSRQQSPGLASSARSRLQSPAVVRMKRFCLEFFFLYTESFFLYFSLNSFDYIILNRQIFFFKCKHIQFQLSLDMYIYVLVYTKFRGEVNKSRATQHTAPHMHAHIPHALHHACV